MPGELELAKELKVGRTSVREAMRQLASWGMVLVRPKHKTVVLPKESWLHFNPEVLSLRLKFGDREEVFRDLTETRLSIEPDVAFLAAERADENDLVAMSDAVDRMRKFQDSPKKLIEEDANFHRALFLASKNSFFYSFFLTLGRIVDMGIADYHKPRDTESPIREHEIILQRVRDRDAVGAMEAMRTHLQNSQRDDRGHFGI